MQANEPWDMSKPIRQECWDDFQKQRQAVYDQMVYLRTALYLLRELASFPFDRFTNPDDRIFFTMASRGLYETAVLAVTKLTTDQGDALTLNRCRNLVRDMVRPDLRDAFDDEKKKTKFDSTAKQLASRAKELRNARLAHLSLPEVLTGSTRLVPVTELEQLADDIEKLYQPLVFGASVSFLLLAYDPEVRAANPRRETDIERILNCLARENYVLNEPEAHPATWPGQQAKMSPDELATFNVWRKRAGLPQL